MARNQHDRSFLEAALLGYEAQMEKITAAIADIQRRIGTAGTAAVPAPGAVGRPARRKKHQISPEGRKRIAEAQRKRWAASKGQAEPSAPKAAKKAKRKLSAEGRANIVAALKKRWAAINNAGDVAGSYFTQTQAFGCTYSNGGVQQVGS